MSVKLLGQCYYSFQALS